jgi:DnaJ-domain-containing protein 1
MDRASHRFDFARAEVQLRACDSSGCSGEGLYRAPKSNRQLREYHWFCLDHVREYNKAWNFCSGMSEAEIEAMVRRDTTWERETRPISHWVAHEEKLHAAAQAYARGEAQTSGEEWKNRQKAREPETPEAAALRLLGLTPPVDYAAIRARYIELVKINHPDTNGGDKESEERLKTINQALQTLKAAYLA